MSYSHQAILNPSQAARFRPLQRTVSIDPGFRVETIAGVLLVESLLLAVLATPQPNAVLLGFFGVLNLLLLAGGAVSEIFRGRSLPFPIAAYFVSAALRLGAGPCHLAACVWLGRKDVLGFGPTEVSGYLMRGFALFVLGDALLIIAYWFVVGNPVQARRSPSSRLSRKARWSNASLLLAAGWILSLLFAMGYSGVRSSSVLATLASALPSSGVLILFGIARSSPRDRTKALKAAWGITMVNVGLGMMSTTKSSALIPLMPGMIHVLGSILENQGQGRLRVRISSLVLGFSIAGFVILFLFPFVQQLRAVKYESGHAFDAIDRTGITSEVLASSIPGTAAFFDYHQFPKKGMWSFTARQTNVLAVAFSMQHVNRSGTTGGRFLRDGMVSVVPRVLWPDKPTYTPGQIIATMTGHDSANGIAFDAGDMAGGLYLDLGLPGVILGMLLNGILLGMMSRLFIGKAYRNPAAATALMLMYILTFKHFENGIDWNLPCWVLLGALFLCQMFWSQLFPQPVVRVHRRRRC